MDDRRLVDALRSLPTPDAPAAEERARELVVAAHAARRTPPPSRRPGWPPPHWPAIAVGGLIAASLALTAVHGGPPVVRWVRDALRTSAQPPAGKPVAVGALPGGGRLLVMTGRDAWIVGQGLAKTVGHTYGGTVAWSAFGNYIACACGRDLRAVALNGRLAWIEHFPAPVQAPIWSSDGNRIAFAVGGQLYLIAGDGTRAHPLVTPRGGRRPLLGLAAWRPGPGHELAVHDAAGRISLIDTDRSRDLARIPIGPHAVALSWSRDGRRLLAASAATLRVYTATGRLIAVRRPPPGTTVRAAALAPPGDQLAVIVSRPDRSDEALLTPVGRGRPERLLLVGAALGDLRFSPDGRWVLVGWHELDSWMFFTTTGSRLQVRQVTRVAAHVANGEPVVAGWCCVARPPPTG